MEFVRRDAKADKAVVHNLISTDKPEVPIDLGKEQGKLRFVDSHWNDLKTLIEELMLTDAQGA
jgi:hypothetical protein